MEILPPIRNDKTGESLRVLESTREIVRFEFELAPGQAIPAPHFHPASEQHIEVLAGELHLYVDGEHRVVRAGDALSVPAGVTHYQWNPGEVPVCAIESYRPAGELHEMFETFFRLASDGMLRRGGGIASPLLVAAFFAEFRSEVRAWPGIAQWGLDMLGPLARWLGHGKKVSDCRQALRERRDGGDSEHRVAGIESDPHPPGLHTP